MRLQSKSHLRNNFLHTEYFRPRYNLFLRIEGTFIFCRLLCLFGELMENKSNWMTFWRGIICCAWTSAGGLSAVLDPIKREWMSLLFAHCTCYHSFEPGDCLYTRLTMRETLNKRMTNAWIGVCVWRREKYISVCLFVSHYRIFKCN